MEELNNRPPFTVYLSKRNLYGGLTCSRQAALLPLSQMMKNATLWIGGREFDCLKERCFGESA